MTTTCEAPPSLHQLLEIGASEALHPDLEAALCEGPCGPMLHHPLYISILHRPQLNALANATLARRRQQLREQQERGDLGRFVFLHERPYRIDAFFQWVEDGLCKPGAKAAESYWTTLASAWIDSENIHEAPDRWRQAWLHPPCDYAQHRHLAMDDEERSALEAMPEVLTVYHGEERPGAVGWSWTTSLDVAAWFAKRFSAGASRPIYEARVRKAEVIAYLNGRNEQEILVDPARLISIHKL